MTTQDTYDVAVIGYGPIGMMTSMSLAEQGHRVVVLERYPGLYELSRACIFDDETMRTFMKVGIGETLLPLVHAQEAYEWHNGAGEVLIEHEFSTVGRSGWSEWYEFYQPELEDTLSAKVKENGVEVRMATKVVGYEQDDEGVTVQLEDGGSVRARYVVACDGGNSFTRQYLGIEQTDHGFSEPWMVCDFRLKDGVPDGLPMARQVCDPEQPIAIISMGPKYHRFSFMLDSEAAFETDRDPDKVWARVAKYLTPEDADLIRVATYTFRSRISHQWREGRIILAGDAPHQMPPFLGQGMCSGVRDSQNLSFKLDLVLRGIADDSLLDTYQVERQPHVTAVTLKGIELGKVQTMRDPVKAAERDAGLKAKHAAKVAPEKIRFPGLGPGLIRVGDVAAGELSHQGFVTRDGVTELFDTVVGKGHVLVVDGRQADAVSVGSRVPADADIPVTTAVVGGDQLGDPDGVYAAWFDEHGVAAVLVRPDFYIYGTAADLAAAPQLVEDYFAALRGPYVPEGIPA